MLVFCQGNTTFCDDCELCRAFTEVVFLFLLGCFAGAGCLPFDATVFLPPVGCADVDAAFLGTGDCLLFWLGAAWLRLVVACCADWLVVACCADCAGLVCCAVFVLGLPLGCFGTLCAADYVLYEDVIEAIEASKAVAPDPSLSAEDVKKAAEALTKKEKDNKLVRAHILHHVIGILFDFLITNRSSKSIWDTLQKNLRSMEPMM
ncbi:hypothetical protein SOVF_090280 [Spinacia oleracea]|nr:hypothetical protein SOVF_090280 [Spinacia oleracea]